MDPLLFALADGPHRLVYIVPNEVILFGLDAIQCFGCHALTSIYIQSAINHIGSEEEEDTTSEYTLYAGERVPLPTFVYWGSFTPPFIRHARATLVHDVHVFSPLSKLNIDMTINEPRYLLGRKKAVCQKSCLTRFIKWRLPERKYLRGPSASFLGFFDQTYYEVRAITSDAANTDGVPYAF